ncbi:hypothetical protein WJX72_000564 [[Myrmecia] bisecta]|uniref:SREBP regulating gene protein n=1 Tax=[Myrmecia] bisecta TaxID=41462 RepID=A0AAW1Q0A3_9CHLO
MHAQLLSLAVALLCLSRSASSASYRKPWRRKLLIRDIPQPHLGSHAAGCNNTAQGRSAVADDRGFLCLRKDFDSSTGCCVTGEQFSCKTCLLDNKCCEEFEQCVSCCLAPQHDAATVVANVFRSNGRPETGRWNSAFEYCRGKCRTTSRSTVHENAYLDTHHHCFSESGKPTTPGPPTPKLPAG